MGGKYSKTVAVSPKSQKKTTPFSDDDFNDPTFFLGQAIPENYQEIDNLNMFKDSSRSSLRSEVSAVSWFSDNSSIMDINYTDYQYPFENIVFEGGGNKGIAYAGAIRVLEDVGIWQNIIRLAGASAGAMTAALLAVGFTSNEIENFLRMDLRKIFLDARCGVFSLLPNLNRYYGWHPGKRLFNWFGDQLYEVTQNRDITFLELYTKFGKELCIVVTNINRMDVEYCHVKTTPNLPIRIAVRMSMAIPGLFGSVKYFNYGTTDIYVDGGLLCNYPVHCFDGWWLSLNEQDSFLRRLQPLEDIGRLWDKKERFGTPTNKTIGLLLYASDESDLMMSKLNRRVGIGDPPDRPDTKLSRERAETKCQKLTASREHAVITEAMSMFMKVLAENDITDSYTVSKEELAIAFNKVGDQFTEAHAKKLFGKNYKLQDVFDSLDTNKDGKINFQELMAFIERRGIGVQSHFLGYNRRNVTNFREFLSTVQESLLVNVKRVFVEKDDIERTIGIDTVYLNTTDFNMETADKDFLVAQGARATRSFLRHWIRNNNPIRQGVQADDNKEDVLFHESPKETKTVETEPKVKGVLPLLTDKTKKLPVTKKKKIVKPIK
ncbi:uncharacterized protein [Antedon mediterranea]|uniref:uncharacterized protein n=1 Tax=Antedon mediterranea TaxID=105859 RepID=UPI003AF56ED7